MASNPPLRKRPAAGVADAQSPDKPLLAADRIRRTARKCSSRRHPRRGRGRHRHPGRGDQAQPVPQLRVQGRAGGRLSARLRRRVLGALQRRCDAHPGDPRAQLMAYLTGLSQRAVQAGYRGCGLTNAAVEYPEDPHPARAVAVEHKVELRGGRHGARHGRDRSAGAGRRPAVAARRGVRIQPAVPRGRAAGQLAQAAGRLIDAWVGPAPDVAPQRADDRGAAGLVR